MGGSGGNGVIDLSDHVFVEIVGYERADDHGVGVSAVDRITKADSSIRGNRE